MSLEDALLTIKPKRDIKPNSGFLEQLIKFERLHPHELKKWYMLEKLKKFYELYFLV